MRIVADENIALVHEYFGQLGELRTLPGRAITAEHVRDADALLVRSVTRVDSALLSGSRCRFVGTATSGIDHVDTGWLQQQGIRFGWARGCNANAVVEYVLCALAQLSASRAFDWRRRSVGIIGCGEVGSRLARKLLGLQMKVSIYDPFLDAGHPLAWCFADLETVLKQEVVTLHTPLTRDTPWPTLHLLDARRLGRLDPATILVNAARGAVIDNKALAELLTREPERLVVLDAWEEEPGINQALLALVALGTAHIAGYSSEGKLNGTRMIATAFSEWFGVSASGPSTPAAGGRRLQADITLPPLEQLNQLMLSAYDITRDHQALAGLPDAERPGDFFDVLRKQYPARNEFASFSVDAVRLHPEVAGQAAVLGFAVTK